MFFALLFFFPLALFLCLKGASYICTTDHDHHQLGLFKSFEVDRFIVEVSGYYIFAILYYTRTTESEEYLSKVASQEHNVSGDFRWLSATFDNPASAQNSSQGKHFICL